MSGFAASKAMEPAAAKFYERNPMAADAAAFMATAATGNPAIWYGYQGVKGYHNGGAVGAVTAMADTALIGLSYVTPFNANISYTHDGGFGGGVGVGVGSLANAGVNYSELNGAGASVSVGGGVGLGLKLATSQYGGNSIGVTAGFGFGEQNKSGVLTAGLSYNTKTGAGADLGFSKGVVDPGSKGFGASANAGLSWNETNGFGGSVGASLSHNPDMVDEFRNPGQVARTSPLSGSGLSLAYNEREGLSMSGSLGGASVGSFNFDSGEFAYNENFGNDAGRAVAANEYQREAAEELQAGLKRAFVDNRDKITDAEWEAYEKGDLSPEGMSKILKRVNKREGLANVTTDESSLETGFFEDFWGKAVMLGETIAGRNANRFGHIDRDTGEFTLRTCFVENTPVQISKNGPGVIGRDFVDIEDVEAGDWALSYNEATGAYEWKQVTQTFVRKADRIYVIEYGNGQILETTWSHPFYIIGEGWVEARRLRVGDVSKTAHGTQPITAVTVEARHATVYNFSVADNKNYFVGESLVLVHNSGYGGPPPADLKAMQAKYDLKVKLTEEKLKKQLALDEVEKVVDANGRVIGFKEKVGSDLRFYDVDGKVVWMEEAGLGDGGPFNPVDGGAGAIFKKALGTVGAAIFGGRNVGKAATELGEEGLRRMARNADEAESAIAAGVKKSKEPAGTYGTYHPSRGSRYAEYNLSGKRRDGMVDTKKYEKGSKSFVNKREHKLKEGPAGQKAAAERSNSAQPNAPDNPGWGKNSTQVSKKPPP
ncbi:MAG: polymorphic toxin-type HINT domain-containing protein, partial [Leptospirales bacterium]